MQENEKFIHRTPIIPFAFLAVMSSAVYYLMGQPILILLVPFWFAYLVWFFVGRHKPISPTKYFLTIFIGMYVTQFFHLMEEWNTGFYDTFPALWGDIFYAQPDKFKWDIHIFITGNLVMDAIWAICLLLFEKRNSWANYNLYGFLAGMLINAVGHPLYCVYLLTHKNLQNYLTETYNYHYTWYFPGLFTALIHSVFCYLMYKEIQRQNSELKIKNASS
jgi:hypothetical protein